MAPQITGTVGDDTFDPTGAPFPGYDVGDELIGDTGDDTYNIGAGDATTFITEVDGQGDDTVNSQSDFDMAARAAFVENLNLSGAAAVGDGNDEDNVIIGTDNGVNYTLSGAAGADTITGNDLADIIDGGDDADILDGGAGADTLTGGAGNDEIDGGTGDDTMIGGTGNDTYYVDSAADVVTEGVGEGTDLVISDVNIAALAANVENLDLQGAAAEATGNALANVITGTDNGVQYTLSGAAGADTITGNNQADIIDGGDDADILDGGDGADTITGGAGNDTITGGLGDDTMVGNAGDDTYYVDSAADVVTEASAEGTDLIISTTNIAALAANVENLNLVGGAANEATGNTLDNVITGTVATETYTLAGGDGADTLTGNDLDDILDGGTGADTMVGHDGNDTYIVDNTSDVVTEGVGEGTDLVQSSITYTLGANVENLTLTGVGNINGTGNDLGNVITGNAGNNVISGGNAADTLVGGDGADTLLGGDGADTLDGGLGADRMVGGDADDAYVVDNEGDIIVETSAGGEDSVSSSIDYSLGSNLEHLTLTGTAAVGGGNSSDNEITGANNAVDYTFTGAAGNDTLTSAGGADTLNGGTGDDTMVGGDGDDVYYVDSASDVVTEGAGGGSGNDTVNTSINYTVAANVENVTAIANNLTLTGSDGVANVLTSYASAAGRTTMVGGTGNDTYIANSKTDIITEAGAAGTDTIFINWANNAVLMSDLVTQYGANIESFLIGSGAGPNAIIITEEGARGETSVGGTAGNDVIDGGASRGSLVGGTGDDTYVIRNGAQSIVENGGEGTDEVVIYRGRYTLDANVDNLTLGGRARFGTGNGDANALVGNDANNVLDGAGGADAMTGGDGNDTYYVDNVLDTVTENADEGTRDLIISSVTYTASANVENLTLTGNGNIDATGNALDNQIRGNSGDNVIDGAAGADRMWGFAGNDTYTVDNAGDRITDTTGTADHVILTLATGTFTMGRGIESMDVNAATVRAVGNSADNVIDGNGVANTIDGGRGNDTIDAGAGADTVWGGHGDDIILGNDDADILRGDAGDDTIEGGAGADTIYGGLGDDLLTGDAGADIFVFESRRDGSDTITDFVHNTDKIDLTDLLTGYDPLTDNIADFVQIDNGGANGLVQVDLNGAAGGANWVTIATLTGVTNATVVDDVIVPV